MSRDYFDFVAQPKKKFNPNEFQFLCDQFLYAYDNDQIYLTEQIILQVYQNNSFEDCYKILESMYEEEENQIAHYDETVEFVPF